MGEQPKVANSSRAVNKHDEAVERQLARYGQKGLLPFAASRSLASRGLADLARVNSPEVNAPGRKLFNDALGCYDLSLAALSGDEAIGHFEDAIRHLTDALRYDPQNAAIYLLRGKAWAGKVGAGAGYECLAPANEDFDTAIDLDPSSSSAYLERGMANISYSEDYEEWIGACDDFDEAIRLDPENATAYYERAKSYRKRDRPDLVWEDFSEALRLDPTNVLWYSVRASWSECQKDYERAIQDYDEIIHIDPDDGLAYAKRGRAWFSMQDYDRAIADFNVAILLSPNIPFATDRGKVWLRKQRYDLAIKDYEAALRIHPSAGNYCSLAALLTTCPDESLRDPARAIELTTKACELTGWSTSLYLPELAAAHAAAGQFDEAARYLRMAIEDAERRRKKSIEESGFQAAYAKHLDELRRRLELYTHNRT